MRKTTKWHVGQGTHVAGHMGTYVHGAGHIRAATVQPRILCQHLLV